MPFPVEIRRTHEGAHAEHFTVVRGPIGHPLRTQVTVRRSAAGHWLCLTCLVERCEHTHAVKAWVERQAAPP